ncbi:putative Ig domain-containing protein, partial [Brucella intermedia]|uniref:putative Ig domain-containing protein n=1 Tax=Brucella intermedia TaxID=94625 RepID=UPI003F16A70F
MTALTPAKQGVSYSHTLQAEGGTSPYTFTADTLPQGLELRDGVLSGTPTESGDKQIEFTVTDAEGFAVTQPLTLSIKEKPAITVTALTPAKQGVSYSHTLQAEGGTSPYTFTADTLPQGLELR